MTISQATLNRVRYYPELLPDAGTVTMGAAVQTAAQVQLRRFTPQVLRMGPIQQPIANAEIRITTDDLRHNVDLNSITGLKEQMDMECLNYLDFSYFSTPGVVAHTYIWGLWVDKMNVANKIARGQKLAGKEIVLANKRGIANSVEKGVLPLPIGYQLEREYRPIQEFTRAKRLQLAGGVTDILDTIMCQPDEALILTSFIADSGAALADNVRIMITRDDDDNYIDFPCWPISGYALLAPIVEKVSCWIPAIRQIRLSVTSTNAVANWDVNYTIRRVRLTNTLRARWGLAPTGQISEADWTDLQEAVEAGIL